MKNKILIAGSSGVIGSFLSTELRKNGYNVYGIGAEKISIENYTQVNLTDKKNIQKTILDLPKFDVLIFLVALAHEKGKNKELDTFRLINFQTLVNLLEILNENNLLPNKIIFSSTISVYGERYETSEYFENATKAPKSPYAITKLEAENYLLDKYKDKSWILRFTPVYSQNFTLNIDRRTRIGSKFYRIGNGENRLSLLSINNIKCTILAIIEEKVPVGIYNISDNIDYSYNDLLKSVSASNILYIPFFLLKTLYSVNKLIGINFIEENSIKLLTNNLYPSKKIQKFVKLDHNLFE